MQLKEQKLADIHNQLASIVEHIEDHSVKGTPLHQVERHLFSSLIALGLQLLSYYIYLVGRIVQQQKVPLDSQGNKMHNKGLRIRSYFSVFGKLTIERAKYYSGLEKTHYPLDSALGLPKGSYSYLLEDWLAFGAVETDFAQSVSYIERILGHPLHGMQSSRCTYHLSTQVDNFYQVQDQVFQAESTHLSVSYDGKGIPIMRSETERSQENTAIRLSKGQKRDVRREATVSVSSCFRAQKRSAEQIIASLFSKPADRPTSSKDNSQKKQVWHEQKHIRAFLCDKQKAIDYGIDDLLKRDKSGSKPIIVLIDGDKALEKAIKKTVTEKKVAHRVEAYVLDFIHLLEYVWKVANARWGEKHPGRENWVKQQAILLLNSQWKEALRQWQEILDTQQLSTHQAYNVERAITYVSNRPHMLDYKSYLDKGYPITTGAVESACGHFVKSRMERNAMHWGKQGAQEMLNIRAIKKNGDWDTYTKTFIDKEQQAIYNKAA